jgi:acyl-CoA thioester hydrolase
MAELATADALGMPVGSGGAIMPQTCDVFGRMLPEQMLARVYASVGHIIRESQAAVLEMHPELLGRLGGAAVEYRVLYQAWPNAGDRVLLRSAHKDLTPKLRRVIHWLLDPTSGKAWASAEMVSLFLDLKARRSLTLSDAALQSMGIKPTVGLAL